jgi:hypothetical protein
VASVPKNPEQEVTLSLHPPIRVNTPIPLNWDKSTIYKYTKNIFS